MKKIVSILSVLVLLVGSLFAFSGCGEKKDENNGGAAGENAGTAATTTTLSFETPFDLGRQQAKGSVEAPEGFKIVKKGEEGDGDYKVGKDSLYAIIGDKYVIEVGINSYVFYTSKFYKDKYGTVEPSFAAYKEYMSSDLRESYVGRTEKELKAGDRDALIYIYNKVPCVEIDYDDYNNYASIEFKVIPNEEFKTADEAKAFLDDKTFNDIISSFKMEKRNK